MAGQSRRLLLPVLAVSGGCALVYEVIWTRALSLVLGSTTFAVSTMLATFMAGLAAGAALGGRLADRRSDPITLFAYCELGIGIAGTASVPLIYQLPRLYYLLYSSFHGAPVVFFALQTALCALVMALPTVLMGATFPLAAKVLVHGSEDSGRGVGLAYSVNTAGSVIGALAAGFALLPWLGLKGTAMATGGVNLVAGGVLLLANRRWRSAVAATLALGHAVTATVAWSASRPRTTYNFYEANRYAPSLTFFAAELASLADRTLLSERDWAEGEVRAFRSRDGSLVLQVGGKVEGTTGIDMANTLLLAYLPVASRTETQRVLVIGLGAGVTLAAAKEIAPDVEVVEINPGVVDAVRRHGPPGLLDGIGLVRDDARRYLATTASRFDVISSEPSYPTDGSVANLFSREFFAIAAGRLTAGGVYAQWLPYYVLADADVTMVLRTFLDVFPHATLWKVPGSLDLIVVGSQQPLARAPEEVRATVAKLNRGRWPLEFVLSRSSTELARLAARADIPMNTDDRPLLEFRVVRSLLAGGPEATDENRPGTDR